MVQMHDPFALPGTQAALQGARFAGLVARHRVTMGNLVTGTPDHFALADPFHPIGFVGRQDAVIAVAKDMRLAQAFEKGHQFARGLLWLGHGGAPIR